MYDELNNKIDKIIDLAKKMDELGSEMDIVSKSIKNGVEAEDTEIRQILSNALNIKDYGIFDMSNNWGKLIKTYVPKVNKQRRVGPGHIKVNWSWYYQIVVGKGFGGVTGGGGTKYFGSESYWNCVDENYLPLIIDDETRQFIAEMVQFKNAWKKNISNVGDKISIAMKYPTYVLKERELKYQSSNHGWGSKGDPEDFEHTFYTEKVSDNINQAKVNVTDGGIDITLYVDNTYGDGYHKSNYITICIAETGISVNRGLDDGYDIGSILPAIKEIAASPTLEKYAEKISTAYKTFVYLKNKWAHLRFVNGSF